MTDKQIIIDGVDVSGCCQYMPRYMEDYDIDTLNYCRYHFKPCKDVDVKYCYYKQLKRKEQECEELHSRTASIIYSLTGGRLSYSTYTLEGCEQAYHDQLEIDVERATKELEEKLKAKEQECNKLYIQLKSDEKYHKEEENTLRKIIKNKEKRNIELYKENNKLKQTLTEIKEIAEPFCNACQEFEPEKMGRNCMYCNYGKILQKSVNIKESIMRKLDKIEVANMLFKVPLTRKEAYDIIHKPTKKSSKELRKYVLEVFINGCKALLETPNTELI